MGLLLVIYICNQTDRAIFNFLMQPIKHDLGLSDSQLGFLAGPALGLFYATLGVPIARRADRGPRITIMSVALALWSGMVVLTALITQFQQLAFTRIGVGIGEAGFSSIAISVIVDYYAAADRARALSIFMLGLPLGGVVSSLAAGWLNEIYGWRAVFVAAGVPGIILALLLKGTVREPPRDSSHAYATPSASRPRLSAIWSTLWQTRAIRHLALGQGVGCILSASVAIWMPTFFWRAHAIPSGQLGTELALTYGLGGGLGTWLSGHLMTRWASRGAHAQAWLSAITTAAAAPILWVALWCTSAQVALLMLLPAYALIFFFFAPTTALIQSLTSPQARATMASMVILIQMLVAGVAGVQALGLLSDTFGRWLVDSTLGLRWSMTVMSTAAVWAALHFWRAGQFIQQDGTNPASQAQAMSQCDFKPAGISRTK